MYQEDVEAVEHELQLAAIDLDRRENGVWGPVATTREDWIEEDEHEARV